MPDRFRRQADETDDGEFSDLDTELPEGEQEGEFEIERHEVKRSLRMPLDVALFAPGRDASGASERLFIRIPPRTKDWLASFSNDKRFPFRGMNHLVRWCLDQGLRKLDRIRPTPTLSTQVIALQNLLYEEQIAADFATLMQQCENRVTAYLSDGAKGEALRLIQCIVTEVQSMPEGYWKGRYANEIKKRWGDLMSGAGINLNVGSVEWGKGGEEGERESDADDEA